MVINAYSSGVQAHKELLRKNGLTPDAVEDMIDKVHEVRSTKKKKQEIFLFILSYNLPIIFIIINNGGIYAGVDLESFQDMARQDATLKYILLFLFK